MSDIFDRPEAAQALQTFAEEFSGESNTLLYGLPEPLHSALQELIRNSYVRGWIDSIDKRTYH